jgi:hypothetical protein
MKNTIFFLIAALFITASVNAQSTVDSIHAKYQLQPMPEALTIEKTFPVLGSYQLTATDGAVQDVNITLDSANNGIIWIAGLPEGTIKAYLRQSPGTYRIISQKSESGKQVPEGTLYFDGTSNTLNIVLGQPYDAADPIAVFNLNTSENGDVADNATEVKVKTKTPNSKTKTKLIFYTATKAEINNSTSTNAAMQ